MSIQVNRLTKTFDPADGVVLEQISFALQSGETLAVIGPSGCGKTTLLYILAGLQYASSGTIEVNGQSRGWTGASSAMILQNYGLFPWKTVSANIALGLKLRRTPEHTCRQVTGKLLMELGLEGLGERYPVQLSGGQQQRVAIARALAVQPDILLMDEPFSSLDAMTREHLQNLLLTVWQQRRLTYVLVTHSVEAAVFLGPTIMVLSDRPTRVKALIRNDEFGLPPLRTKNGYFDRVRQVRQAIQG